MRILLVAPTAPLDTSFGAAQRTTLLYRALLEHGDVDVVVMKEGPSFAADPGEQSCEVARLTVRPSPWHAKYRPDGEIRQWAQGRLRTRYDVVVCRELSTACRFRQVIDAPLIADADDAYYRYVASDRSIAARALSVVKTAARRQATRSALSRFAHVWFASARDQQHFPHAASSVLPNVAPEVAEQPAPRPDMPVILFVGALWYGPNVDAVNWFVSRCWPRIRHSIPNARLRIVGACPVSRRETWTRYEGVECPGFVADLAAEYRAAHFTIAPVRFGGGTQIKTLESLAYGRTAVVSSFVFAGYAKTFASGSSLVVADTPDDMIECCVDLLRDPEKAARIALAGRDLVLKSFGWPVFRNAVAEAIAHLPAM